MNLKFKAALQKEWTLLDDKVILGKKEILLKEIKSVKLFARPTLVTNGVIQILVDNKYKNLVYTNKSKSDGDKAYEYLQDNCGDENQLLNRKKTTSIQDEIDALPYKDVWGTRKEIYELPNVLNPDEHIKAMTSGLTDGNTWLMVCTNRRVLMLDKGMLYGLKLIDIPLDRINSISHSKGLVLGKISITDGAVTRTIENISNVTVSFFSNAVNKEIEIYKKSKNVTTTQVIKEASPADELIKYKQLLDMGALTEEEFDIKKKEILGL
ncbi:PH domain-containing protein [Paraclostridium sordellii]|uniref:PH domain-containing protein n=1 Tax=Paraclostridium sordellii TaxID=1505 RepID=UPI0022E7CCA1|nr:PH domain-containing protein [Paeniclostridium sordellii]